MSKELYRYVIASSIKSHTAVPHLVDRVEGLQGFTSLYAVTQETAQAIEQAGTTSHFKGVVWSERLWLDFDSYEAAAAAERRLKEMGYGFHAYDSGGRGVHFGILRDTAPSHLLPAQDKAWATEHFPDTDPSIYSHLHLFRLPGTVHESTGRKKTLVLQVPGPALTHPKWENTYDTRRLSHSVSNGSDPRSVFDHFRVMSNTRPVPVGERHASLVRLCYALRDDARLSPFMALWWLGEANKLFDLPKTSEELEQITRSIYG